MMNDEVGGFKKAGPRNPSGYTDDAEKDDRKKKRRETRPDVPENYAPIVELVKTEKKSGERMEEALLADGWEPVEKDSPKGNGADPVSAGSLFPEIARVKAEILKGATSGYDSSDASIGSRVSDDALRGLTDIRKARLAERIDGIVSDPTKNAEQILKELKSMGKEESSVDNAGFGKGKSGPDVPIVADVLARIDAVRPPGGDAGREKSAKKERSGKVSFAEIKEYLSELSMSHFLDGMKKGRFDKSGVPHLSLDTLVWEDGRPVLNVIASKDRSATAKLLKDMETELAELNESELARRMDISNNIALSFLEIQKSIESIEQTDDAGTLEAISFPVPMRRMRELGFDELPEQRREVLARKQKHALKRWGAAKDTARKRLSGTGSPKRKSVTDPAASESPADPVAQDPVPDSGPEAALSTGSDQAAVPGTRRSEVVQATEDVPMVSGNPERDKQIPRFEDIRRYVADEMDKHKSSVLEKIRRAEETGDRDALTSLRNASWRVHSRSKSHDGFSVARMIDGLSAEEKDEIGKMIADTNARNKDLVKGEINRVFLFMANRAMTTTDFYLALERMSNVWPIDGEAADGKILRSRLAKLAASALSMDDEEFASGEWKREIPESLREKFSELITNRRGEGRVAPESTPVAEPAVDPDLAKEIASAEKALLENDPSGKAPADAMTMEVGEHADDGPSVSEGVKVAYDESLAAARRYNDEVRKSVEDISESVSPEEKLLADEMAERASVDSGMKKDRERTAKHEETIAERRAVIEKLHADAKEQSFRVAELENERQRVQGQLEKSEKQDDIYRKVKEKLGKFFGSDTVVAKKLQDEERQNRKYLEELDERIAQETLVRDRLRAKLKEAENELEQIGTKVPDISDKPADDAEKASIGTGKEGGNGLKSEAEPERSGKERVIYPSAAERFGEEFDIYEHDLEKVGLGNLSEGQQLLVLENLKQLTVGRIQEEAIDRTDEDTKVDTWISGTNWIRKGWRSASRKYQIAKTEKLTQKEIMRGGMAVHGEILKQLVEGALSSPEVEVIDRPEKKTPIIRVNFAGGKQFADIPESERSALDAFNIAAHAFSEIPAEWRYTDSAKKKDHGKYEEGERRYVEARDSLLRFLGGRYGEEEALWTINDLESKVRMTQFLQTTADAEDQLRSIRDDAAWTRMWKDSITEHGVAFGLGFGARTAAAASAGFLATPLVLPALAAAGLVGGVRAYIRSKEQLKEKERRSRKGRGEEKDPTKEKFPSVELSSELTRLSDASLDAFGEKDQEEKLIELRKSLDIIRKKLENGMVDFGTENEASGNEYSLLQALSRAGAVVAMYSAEESSEFETRFNEAVASNDRFIDVETARAKKKQMEFVGKNIATGAVISATFAGLGYGARYVAEHGSSILGAVSDRLAVPDGAKETLDDAFGTSPGQAPAGEPSAWLKSAAEPVETPAKTIPVPAEHSVPDVPEQRDSMTPEDDWDAASVDKESRVMNASFTMPEASAVARGPFIGFEESVSSKPAEPVPSKSVETISVKSGIGVGADELHGRVSLVGRVGPGLSPEEQAMILNTDQPVADQVSESVTESPADPSETLSKTVSDSWTENAADARLSTADAKATLGYVQSEVPIDTPESGAAADEATESAMASPKTSSEPVPTEPPVEMPVSDTKTVQELVMSDRVRGYLLAHPENIESFRKSLGDYDASIFEAARGETGMRGVASMAELNDSVKANQVMYDCLKLIRDPLTPAYEVKTYQLANSLNFDQMRNVGEFMMKASERFGRGAIPIGDESLRGYIERMTALFTDRGETIRLNGDMRFLKQLAFQSIKR
jgi:hypothetical protein